MHGFIDSSEKTRQTPKPEPADRPAVPKCYRCAEQGHTRGMILIERGAVMTMKDRDKPWSPTQGCFQCGNCGRLTCSTHSELASTCACGAHNWIEKQYLQQEFDNG